MSNLCCTPLGKSYYSYKIDTFANYGSLVQLSTQPLISYGDYLFEFRLVKNINETSLINGTINEQKITYDTAGVYVLQTSSKYYFEFDSFNDSCKLVKSGLLVNKERGVKQVTSLPKVLPPGVFFTPVHDTLINNINCFTSTLASSDVNLVDSSIYSIVLMRKKGFNSIYRVFNSNFIDTSYCIISSIVFNKYTKDIYFEEISNLKVLNIREEKICDRMVKIIIGN